MPERQLVLEVPFADAGCFSELQVVDTGFYTLQVCFVQSRIQILNFPPPPLPPTTATSLSNLFLQSSFHLLCLLICAITNSTRELKAGFDTLVISYVYLPDLKLRVRCVDIIQQVRQVAYMYCVETLCVYVK